MISNFQLGAGLVSSGLGVVTLFGKFYTETEERILAKSALSSALIGVGLLILSAKR